MTTLMIRLGGRTASALPWNLDLRSAPALERHDVSAGTQTVETVGPCLHHLPPLGKPLRFVVGGADLVALRVGELQLDDIGRKALLIEERARHAAEPMAGLLLACVSHAPQSRVDCVVGHRTVASAKRREKIPPSPRQWLKLGQNRQRLARERND